MQNIKTLHSIIGLLLLSTNIFAQYCTPVISASDTIVGVKSLSFVQINTSSLANEGYVDRTLTDTAIVARGGYYRFTLGSIPDAETVKVWFDWNQDDDFDDLGEKIFDEELPGSDNIDRDIFIPLTATLGTTRLRIRTDDFGGWESCDPTTIGEAEDFTIIIIDQDMIYRESDVRQKTCNIPSKGCFTTVPVSNTEVISIEIDMQYTLNPLTANEFTFDMTGSTNPAAITTAKLWHTTSDLFDTSTLVGSFINPNGVFTITSSQILQSGQNYFWLTFNISDDALSGDLFDAACNSINIGGSNQIPTNMSQPSTCRIIDLEETYGPKGNLVPNYSFEEYDCCPPSINTSKLHTPYPWTSPTAGTADHYHECNNSLDGKVGVPNKQQGYQLAQEGNGHAGTILYSQFGTSREYITTYLKKPLDAGRNYCASMYFSRADGSQYSMDRIGMFFSTFDTDTSGINVLPYTPQLETTPGVLLSDTSSWTQLSGNYLAAGGERYITIGNFYDNANTNGIQESPGAPYNWAYYFYDNVTIIPSPILNFATHDTSICQNSSITIGKLLEEASSYFWSTGDTTPFITVSPLDTTTYFLTVTNNCSSDSDSITVSVIPLPNLSLTADTMLCIGDSIQLIALSSGHEYLWTPNTTINANNISNPIIFPSQATTYIIKVTDTLNSCSDIDSVEINIINVDVELGADTTFCTETSTLLLDAGTGFDTYLWSTNETTSSIEVTDSGVYMLSVTLLTCQDNDTIKISRKCPLIFIPNAFTPNDDGDNDVFKIIGVGIKSIKINIYDRWGKKIFETTDINNSWDGFVNGKEGNQGIYVYVVKGKFDTGKEFNMKGNISLIR